MRVKTLKYENGNYTPVNKRVLDFRKEHPKGTIKTKIIQLIKDVTPGPWRCVMKAKVYDEDGRLLGTGTAIEFQSSSKEEVNFDSFLENCETSAVGRALGFAGYGIDTAIASLEEVQKRLQDAGVEKAEVVERRGVVQSTGDRLNNLVSGKKNG